MYPVLLSNGHFYDESEATSRRLAREYAIEHSSYEQPPGFTFAPCDYCDGIQHAATLSWNWGAGSAESCPSWECARAVLDEALEAAYPENILVANPAVPLPEAFPEAA